MDKTKNPGIALKGVHLIQCNIGDVKYDVELKFALGITDFDRHVDADGKILQVKVAFNLMDKMENPPCRFDCVFVATYTRPEAAEMKWEEFKDHVAVAHLIPYVREFVSNMTTRLPLTVLMIPPMNTSKMLADFMASRVPTSEPSPIVSDMAHSK
jgi:hypothetical protein